MAGGYYSERQRDREQTLGERTQPPHEVPTDPPSPAEPRPCWLSPSASPTPGHVLAWRHVGEGQWRALVIVDVDAEQVRAREQGPDPKVPPSS